MIEQYLRAAHAMLLAGNFPATERHLKKALEIDPDNSLAYSIQHDLLMQQGNISVALQRTRARILRVPTCQQARLNAIIIHGSQQHRLSLNSAIKSALENFSEDPALLQDVRLLQEMYSGSLRHAKSRLAHIRQSEYSGHLNLLQIEKQIGILGRNIGDIAALNASELAKGNIDASTLIEQAHLALISGSMLKAFRYAHQSRNFDAKYALLAREISVLASLSLLPIFWCGWSVLMISGGATVDNFSKRFFSYSLSACALLTPILLGTNRGVTADWTWWVICLTLTASCVYTLYVRTALGTITRKIEARRSKSSHLPPDY